MKALKRFLDIIEYNQHKDEVLAFLGLGSMHDQSRMDPYSDVDFFLIVKEGFQKTYLEDVSWLHVRETLISFQETDVGYKVIYDDGVLLEFAVFEPSDLKKINIPEGTLFYMSEVLDRDLFKPTQHQGDRKKSESYLIQDVLSNLYVGVLRTLRGEYVSAFLMIQVYAAHKTLLLLNPYDDDMYVVERRIENRLDLDYAQLFPGVKYNFDSVSYQLTLLEAFLKPYTELVQMMKQLMKEGISHA